MINFYLLNIQFFNSIYLTQGYRKGYKKNFIIFVTGFLISASKKICKT
jgi:hypothetical protein